MEWGAAITAVFAVVLALLKWWQSQQPARDQEQRYDEIQQGRADIANGDVNSVNARIDRLLSRQSQHAPGQRRDEAIAGSLGTILGVAAAIGSSGPDTGASGILPKGE